MTPGMYRSSGDGFAKQVGSAVVQAASSLAPAMWAKGSKHYNCYVFNNTPIGAQPLVLLGNYTQIMAWLLQHQNIAIMNDLAAEHKYDSGTIDGIYMSVQMYQPGQRFRGLFPLHDAVAAIAKGAVDIAGSGISTAFAVEMPKDLPNVSLNDLGGIEAGLYDAGQKLFYGEWMDSPISYAKNKEQAKQGVLYVRFSYCPCAFSEMVARKRLTMRGVMGILQRSIGA